LLSFARNPPPSERPQRIDELVRSVTSLFQSNANEQKIELVSRVEVEGEVPGVAVPAVRDSLANLILNALQATPVGGRVTVVVSNEARELTLQVTDSGAGVPMELEKRIWEPFFTTKQRGTGLGLAIVRKRMQEAGGSARLASTSNGAGASFELRLPL
jgi:signal transduction histidine kinase